MVFGFFEGKRPWNERTRDEYIYKDPRTKTLEYLKGGKKKHEIIVCVWKAGVEGGQMRGSKEEEKRRERSKRQARYQLTKK